MLKRKIDALGMGLFGAPCRRVTNVGSYVPKSRKVGKAVACLLRWLRHGRGAPHVQGTVVPAAVGTETYGVIIWGSVVRRQ